MAWIAPQSPHEAIPLSSSTSSDCGSVTARLSHLLTKCEASGNAKAVAMITRMSPAAWRHILLNGHYTFQSGGKMIDLDALLAGLDLE